MSKSPKSHPSKRALVTTAVIVVTLALLARPANHYAHSRAMDAVRRGDAQSNIYKSLVWYQVADVLAPHDSQIDLKLAQAYLGLGDDEAALNSAVQAIDHGQSFEGYTVKSQALLEQNRIIDAAKAAEDARLYSDKDSSLLQLGLAYIAAQKFSGKPDLIASMRDSKTVQALNDAQRNNFTFAQLLYTSGLLRTSERVLIQYQVENSQSYLLQARITLQLGQGSKSSLQDSRGLLQKGIAISPERIDLRQLLQSVDNQLGDTAAAGEQGSRIKAIEDGKV